MWGGHLPCWAPSISRFLATSNGKLRVLAVKPRHPKRKLITNRLIEKTRYQHQPVRTCLSHHLGSSSPVIAILREISTLSLWDMKQATLFSKIIVENKSDFEINLFSHLQKLQLGASLDGLGTFCFTIRCLHRLVHEIVACTVWKHAHQCRWNASIKGSNPSILVNLTDGNA
jgi:hypothetical protein